MDQDEQTHAFRSVSMLTQGIRYHIISKAPSTHRSARSEAAFFEELKRRSVHEERKRTKVNKRTTSAFLAQRQKEIAMIAEANCFEQGQDRNAERRTSLYVDSRTQASLEDPNKQNQ